MAQWEQYCPHHHRKLLLTQRIDMARALYVRRSLPPPAQLAMCQAVQCPAEQCPVCGAVSK